MDGWLTHGSCACKPAEGRVEKGRDGVVRQRFFEWKARLAVVGTEEDAGVDTVCPSCSGTIGIAAVRLTMRLM